MASKVFAYSMGSASYMLVGRAALLTGLPDRVFGGPNSKAVDLRGEYLKTYFLAKVEVVASIFGMIFWGVATLISLWDQSCKEHFLAHAGALLASISATAIGIAGTIYPELGKALGIALLIGPIVSLVSDEEKRNFFSNVTTSALSAVPQQFRPTFTAANFSAENLSRYFRGLGDDERARA